MQLDCLTFYQDWLKCLNTKAVKCGSTVKHNRMILNNNLKSIPYCGILRSFNLFSCGFNI